jgi:hypothetical protein
LVKVAGRVGSGRQASRVAIDQVPGALDLDPTASDDANHDLVTGLQTCVLENPDWERDLMFA